jgi:hypothetical protein
MPAKSKRLFILVATIAAVVAAAAALLLFVIRHPSGLTAEITNTGVTPMRSIAVHVTGRSYPLGDLRPGESRRVRVDPAGESHLELAYTDPTGAPQSLTADCYFESGYRGQITVDVTNGKVTRVNSQFEPY